MQPLLVRRAREGEDFTRSRPDFGDAVIIARLTAELRCYLPYRPEGPWGAAASPRTRTVIKVRVFVLVRLVRSSRLAVCAVRRCLLERR